MSFSGQNTTEKNVAIVGAGPSGCICAYYLIKAGISVTIFDKGTPLRTLLPTGGGRCNLAHAEFNPKELAENYPRGKKFLYSVFSRFSTYDTLTLFEELGVSTYIQEDRRIFPESNSAKDVRKKILNKIKNIKHEEVRQIKPINGGFAVLTDKSEELFTHVIIAAGGHAGYDLVKPLNIKIVKPKPALVGLNTQENLKDLSGICLNLPQGNILFTHFGISGPLAYRISSIKAFDKMPYELEFDLCPQVENFQKILDSNPHKEIKNILSEYLPLKLVLHLLKGLNETTKAYKIDGKTRDCILDRIHHFKVTITGTNRGEETVTAGGVDLDEINPKTMGVKKIPHLYCIGEFLNIDGFCGGFNLQNAWSTAYIAAISVQEE